MTDWAIYWKNYQSESGDHGEPVASWQTSREWLVNRLHCGDRIWLFVGGDACGDEGHPYRAYVAQLLVVDDWVHCSDNEPEAMGGPRYRIHGNKDRCVLVDPPVEVDGIFRRQDGDSAQHIGIARQTPFELDSEQVAQLLSVLRNGYPAVDAAATQA